MEKFYTGVGSRQLPQPYKDVIQRISSFLDESGYILRSGGADGSDLSFEEKASNKQIFIPWIGFNNNKSTLLPIPESIKFVKEVHPVFEKLNRTSRLLHMRNIHQILGPSLNEPSDFVVCYTEGGKTMGGTATAIRLANKLNIPVFNVGNYDLRIIDTDYIYEQFTDFYNVHKKV